MIKTLSLFSGIGGFDRGLEIAGGFKIVGQVEIDPFCNKVLAKHWPDVKRMQDIKEVKGDEFGSVELISAGVPCQPASCAGKRRGKEDDRWLWDEAFRVIHKAKPAWLILENVGGLITLEGGLVFDGLLSNLEGQGYEVQPFIIPACAVGAPHRRDRVWIIAYSECRGISRQRRIFGQAEIASEDKQGASNFSLQSDCHAANADRFNDDDAGYGASKIPQLKEAEIFGSQPFADSCHQRLQGEQWPGSHDERPTSFGPVAQRNSAWDESWPEVAISTCSRGVDDGVSRRVDRTKRLKALGNAVVPQIVEILGRAIMKAEGII